ncbi:MAG TPA: M67 family metallopeptidase [Chloroflexota bacterium]|nr:M67 family metallopeptidase [Chloroflexota bacterium]
MTDLPRSLAERLIRTAREGAPAEVCGVIGLQGGRIVRLDPVRNAASTPRVRFTFDDDGYRRVMEVEREGLEVGIFHSHPASPAYPSATDRAEMSATWPDCLQLMVSLRQDDTAGPEVYAYRIDRAGAVTPEDLRLVED